MAPYHLCLGPLILGFSAVLTASSSASDTQADLICPTSNLAECYPRLFEPTKEFQQIKEGQQLPPGLHVRMNVYTGEKEARLNVPTAEDLALEASGSQEIVVVPQLEEEQSVEESKPSKSALRDKYPHQPPAFEKAGKILPPRPDDGSGDAESFRSAVKILKELRENFFAENADQDLDLALDVLFDLSNDIYYGVEIAGNRDVLLTLFTLMSSHDAEPSATMRDLIFNFKGLGGTARPDTNHNSPKSVSRRRQAAGILAHAIQNNPTALSELSGQNVAWMEHLCGLIEGETHPAPMKSKIKALSHLLNDPKFRRDFVNASSSPSHQEGLFSNGTQILLSVFLRTGSEWDGVRTQIIELLLDNYVDEEMGGQLGLWPIEAVAGDASTCSKPSFELQDRCWEHHLENHRPELEGKEDKVEGVGKLFAGLKSGREHRKAHWHGEL